MQIADVHIKTSHLLMSDPKRATLCVSGKVISKGDVVCEWQGNK